MITITESVAEYIGELLFPNYNDERTDTIEVLENETFEDTESIISLILSRDLHRYEVGWGSHSLTKDFITEVINNSLYKNT